MHDLRSHTTEVSNSRGERCPVRSFVGIRYARLSDGRRFDLPQPVAPADQRAEQAGYASTGDVPIFPQLPFRLAPYLGEPVGAYPQAEDAFFLNVSVPANLEQAPVLVFVHGGAWVSGAGTYDWYRGERLAAEGICVVTVNYRLHAGGLLTEDSPHLPLLDLTAALLWVQQYIASFGGDPSNVTLAGQSAGGWYVHALAQLPQLRGVSRRIALWSMATRTPWPAELMSTIAEDVRATLRTDDLTRPRSRLLMATTLSAAARRRDEFFGPAHLGYSPPALLPAAASNLAADFLDPSASAIKLHVDQVMLRTCRHETGIFFAGAERELTATHDHADDLLASWLPNQDHPLVPEHLYAAMVDTASTPYERVRAISSWMQFQRLAHHLDAAYRAAGKDVQLHEFTFQSPDKALGSSHCFDLPFQFHNHTSWATAPMLSGIPGSQFNEVASAAVQQLISFMSN